MHTVPAVAFCWRGEDVVGPRLPTVNLLFAAAGITSLKNGKLLAFGHGSFSRINNPLAVFPLRFHPAAMKQNPGLTDRTFAARTLV